MKTTVAAIAAGLLGGLLLARADGPASRPVRSRPASRPVPRIVFCSDRDGSWRLFTCQPDGADIKRLTKKFVVLVYDTDAQKVAERLGKYARLGRTQEGEVVEIFKKGHIQPPKLLQANSSKVLKHLKEWLSPK